jgi:hypothetical protein
MKGSKMKNSNFNRRVAQLTAAGMSLTAAMAQAAVDTTGLVTEVGTAGTAVAAVGAAVLLVMVGIKVYKWVQRSL